MLLLGSKEQVPEEPVTPVKFIEDMNDAEMATAVSKLSSKIKNLNDKICDKILKMELPAGLTNLGNTCYMNATVQCLHAVPELRDALDKYRVDSEDAGSMSIAMASAMKFLFKQMERGSTVTPIILLQTLHRASPQFSQVGENGTYRQQDANECWSELLKMLQQKIPASNDKAIEGSDVKKYK